MFFLCHSCNVSLKNKFCFPQMEPWDSSKVEMMHQPLMQPLETGHFEYYNILVLFFSTLAQRLPSVVNVPKKNKNKNKILILFSNK